MASLTGEVGIPRIFPLLEAYEEDQSRRSRIKVLGRYSSYRQDIIYSPDGCAPTLTVGKGTPTSYIKLGNKIRKLTPVEQERLQGLPDDWTKFGQFEDGVKELSKFQRYSMLGNAITSLVMKLIALKIKPVLSSGLDGINISSLERKSLTILKELQEWKLNHSNK